MQKSLKILENTGLRKTKVRMQVLGLFLKQKKEALSLPKIEEAFEKLDRITLYRTLKTFENKGVIHRALDGTQHPKYALCNDHCSEDHHHDYHAHFHCKSCGKTLCLENVIVPKIPVPKGYQLEETAVVLSGSCEACV